MKDYEEKRKRVVWRDAYKKFCNGYIDELNLQNVFTPYELCNDIIGKLEEYSGKLREKDWKYLVLNLEFVEILMYNYGVEAKNITFVSPR